MRRTMRSAGLLLMTLAAARAQNGATGSHAAGTYTQVVGKADSALRWSTPAPIPFGTALDATQLNATARTPGVFSYTPAAGKVLLPGPQTLQVSFQPENDNFNPSAASVTLQVNTSSTPSFTLTMAPESLAAQPIVQHVNEAMPVHLVVTPLLPVDQVVALTCDAAPVNTTCLFQPSTVTLATRPVDVLLTFQPVPRAALRPLDTNLQRIALAALLLGGFMLRARRRSPSVYAATLAMLVLLSGCSVSLGERKIHVTAASTFESHAVDVRVL